MRNSKDEEREMEGHPKPKNLDEIVRPEGLLYPLEVWQYSTIRGARTLGHEYLLSGVLDRVVPYQAPEERPMVDTGRARTLCIAHPNLVSYGLLTNQCS